MTPPKALAVAAVLAVLLLLVALASAFMLLRQWWRRFRVGQELRRIEADAYRERYGVGR